MKYLLYILILFFVNKSFTQNRPLTKLGQTTLQELKQKKFKVDSSAKAIVIYEKVNVYNIYKNVVYINSDHYKRIKILDKNNTDITTVSIKTYGKEKVLKIKAITYNLEKNNTIQKTFLKTNNIFRKKLSDKWYETSFTFPNVKNGSVIEYSYTVKSPYYTLDDWYFQSYIPKLHSEINVSIYGKTQYRSKLTGKLKLALDTMVIDKNCYNYIFNSCRNLKFGMKNIPAFKDVSYISSAKNLMSKITIDINPTINLNKKEKNIEKLLWKNLDKNFKTYYLKKEIDKANFFKRKLNNELKLTSNNLFNAKTVYNYVKNYFTWNGNNWHSDELDLKNTFKTKTGSAT